MTKVTIGGTDYDVPPMKFKTLKKAYPIIMAARESDDPMEVASVGIEVLSLAMTKQHPDMTPEWLEEEMFINETMALGEFIGQIMVDSGLVTEGDLKTALAGGASGEFPGAAPSTETSTLSSQNSLPLDAAGETGMPSKNDGTSQSTTQCLITGDTLAPQSTSPLPDTSA